jgi:hypothetical protein
MSEYVQDTPLGYDGYERMGFVQRFGWKITPSWGRDGWDFGEPWVEGMETVDDMPDYMRGPFTWERLGRDGVQKGEQE